MKSTEEQKKKNRTRSGSRPCMKCRTMTKTRNYLYVYCKKCTPKPFKMEEKEMSASEVERFLEEVVRAEVKLPWEKTCA